MQIEDNLTLLSTILQRGETILIPSDGVWGLSCDARNQEAVDRLHSEVVNGGHFQEEIIVSNLSELKKYAINLHPRIETLLYYHDRPIRIKCNQKLVNRENIYLRIAKDKVTRILLRELDFPLYFISFLSAKNHIHLTPGEIDQKHLTNLSFIANGHSEIARDYPLITIEYDEEGMIKVLH